MRYDIKELDEWNNVWGIVRAGFISRFIKLKKGRLLDVAGYKGHLKNMVSKDIEYHLIDQYAPKGENFLKYNLDKLKSEKLPYKSKYFDVIVAMDIFEHIKYPMKLQDEIHRILKPKGYLFTSRHMVPTPVHYYHMSENFFADKWKIVWAIPTMEMLANKLGIIPNEKITNFKMKEGLMVPAKSDTVHEVFYCLVKKKKGERFG